MFRRFRPAAPWTGVLGACLLGMALSGASRVEADEADNDAGWASSRIIEAANGERTLVHEARFDAPVSELWAAYTTEEGWTAWASTQARIDLRVGGTIETRYDDRSWGEPGATVLHIEALVPHEVLVLRADVTENWPEILRKDADKLSNVIVFESLGETASRVRSYGVGYGDSPEVDKLLEFFDRTNMTLMEGLRAHLEAGE